MKIIISPAKKMVENSDIFEAVTQPCYSDKAACILNYFRGLSYEEAKELWNCNDSLAKLNYERIAAMQLEKGLTPALLAYQGIQYQYMAPEVLKQEQLKYLSENLRILSAFYGVIRPFDGVALYRLEMQAKAKIEGAKNLYEFWGRDIYDQVAKDTDCILNLASKEYSKCVEKYMEPDIRFVTCIFGEQVNGKIKEKGTYAKMARGEMVRFLAESNADSIDQVKKFNRLGFEYIDSESTESTLVFVRGNLEK